VLLRIVQTLDAQARPEAPVAVNRNRASHDTVSLVAIGELS